MTASAQPLARPDVSTYPLDAEIVIYTPADGQAFVLNATAARIWELCDGTRTEVAMAREIAEAYDQDEARVRADVRELIARLHAAGLVTFANLIVEATAGR